MREGDLTYDDFLQRLNIRDVLIDAGYHEPARRYALSLVCSYRQRGTAYPRRQVHRDATGKMLLQAQQQKVYNIISFIKEHPQFFTEYRVGMSPTDW